MLVARRTQVAENSTSLACNVALGISDAIDRCFETGGRHGGGSDIQEDSR